MNDTLTSTFMRLTMSPSGDSDVKEYNNPPSTSSSPGLPTSPVPLAVRRRASAAGLKPRPDIVYDAFRESSGGIYTDPFDSQELNSDSSALGVYPAPRGGVREEKQRILNMENEIFQLKLKITLLEKHSKLGSDAKALISQLTVAHAENAELARENKLLNQRVEAETSKLNEARINQLEEDKEKQAEKLALQEDTLQILIDAQDEYEKAADSLLSQLKDYCPDEETPTLVDKLNVVETAVSNLLQSLGEAQDAFSKFDEALSQFEKEKHQLEANQLILQEIQHLFQDGPSLAQLPQMIEDILSNNAAIETQVAELSSQVETLRENTNEASLNQIAELEAQNKTLMEAVAKSSTRSYDILRQFFRRLTANMGPQWGEENDQRLRDIMQKAKRHSQSKLPMLVELMIEYIDYLTQRAHVSETLPEEYNVLKQRLRRLESVLSHELSQSGADSVLLARYRELESRLKVLEEKRYNEYVAYQRTLAVLSTQ